MREFCGDIAAKPQDLEKCIHLSKEIVKPAATGAEASGLFCRGCETTISDAPLTWQDSLGRDYDFILDSLPGISGPREVIIPHNPQRTQELDVRKGDILIGRPMGMSCGCPITHCGVAMDVDHVNGVITWCVTGPLNPRTHGYKDVGYYQPRHTRGW